MLLFYIEIVTKWYLYANSLSFVENPIVAIISVSHFFSNTFIPLCYPLASTFFHCWWSFEFVSIPYRCLHSLKKLLLGLNRVFIWPRNNDYFRVTDLNILFNIAWINPKVVIMLSYRNKTYFRVLSFNPTIVIIYNPEVVIGRH